MILWRLHIMFKDGVYYNVFDDIVTYSRIGVISFLL